MIRTAPIFTLFPTRRSSDLGEFRKNISHSRQNIPVAKFTCPPQPLIRKRKYHAHHPRRKKTDRNYFHARPRLLDGEDRKSTRLNSSHTVISYAVFCLKKKKT